LKLIFINIVILVSKLVFERNVLSSNMLSKCRSYSIEP